MVAKGLRRELRGAAGDDDAGAGPPPAGAADRLARLPLGFRCHGAGVDDHRVGEAGGCGRSPHHLGFERVETAAEGHDLDIVAARCRSRTGHRVSRGQPLGIDIAAEAGRRRSGHDDVAVLAPLDGEPAAVELDGDRATGQAAAMRGHRRGAGAGAARRGDAGAALPYPQAQGILARQRGDADIDALREQRVALDRRPHRREIDRFQLGPRDENTAWRVADIDRRGCAQHGCAGRGRLEVELERVHLARSGISRQRAGRRRYRPPPSHRPPARRAAPRRGCRSAARRGPFRLPAATPRSARHCRRSRPRRRRRYRCACGYRRAPRAPAR